jgi:hypothetical protein
MIRSSVISLALSFIFLHSLSMPAASQTDESWDAMMDGIRRYSSGQKLREEFSRLCMENKTAQINGRIDTGGGLYMIMDAPVYRGPGQSKITELPHETIVVLTGESRDLEGRVWKEIEFLFISSHSKAAISIDKAWIEESNLKE